MSITIALRSKSGRIAGYQRIIMRSGRLGSRIRVAAVAALATAVGTPLAAAADWTQWRGPNMMAVIDGRANLPET
jgi:hypothetical protein